MGLLKQLFGHFLKGVMRVDAPNEGNCVNLEDRGGLKSPEGRQGCRKRWFTILVTFAVIFVAAALINYLFRSISGANQPPPSISAGQTNAEKEASQSFLSKILARQHQIVSLRRGC